MPIDPRYAIRALIVLECLGVVSAAIGTVMAIGQDGGGVPLSYLDGTPFTSFVVPGMILGGIVGGTQLVAAFALWRRWSAGLLWSAIAAFGMLLWIFIELAMIQHYSWLQSTYFAFGIVELILVLAALGIAPAAMRRWDGWST